ncbi:hypothetical protein Cni_G05364 [Canna indica]|uniref:Uncharacterized protein n=1 Tax=Canna indica TaxID=4628 RepID=A0AAQ3JV29_9LILI|nr:hypothetical protein Cni_G05364 [Canna indica]
MGYGKRWVRYPFTVVLVRCWLDLNHSLFGSCPIGASYMNSVCLVLQISQEFTNLLAELFMLVDPVSTQQNSPHNGIRLYHMIEALMSPLWLHVESKPVKVTALGVKPSLSSQGAAPMHPHLQYMSTNPVPKNSLGDD